MIIKLFPLPVYSITAVSAATPIDVVETWVYSDSVATEAAIQALYQILIN